MFPNDVALVNATKAAVLRLGHEALSRRGWIDAGRTVAENLQTVKVCLGVVVLAVGGAATVLQSVVDYSPPTGAR